MADVLTAEELRARECCIASIDRQTRRCAHLKLSFNEAGLSAAFMTFNLHCYYMCDLCLQSLPVLYC